MDRCFEVTITDLDSCPACTMNNPMMIQDSKNSKWYIACGYRKCYHKTKMHKELSNAAEEWGLQSEKEDEE